MSNFNEYNLTNEFIINYKNRTGKSLIFLDPEGAIIFDSEQVINKEELKIRFKSVLQNEAIRGLGPDIVIDSI